MPIKGDIYLSPNQFDLLTRLRYKDEDFHLEGPKNYTPALHEFVFDKLRFNMSLDSVLDLCKISKKMWASWRKRYPQIDKDFADIMKLHIENAHYVNASGQQVTREVVNRYNEEEQFTGRIVTEKQHPISTTSLDRLAQKYAPELAPKEKTEIDVDIQVKRIDFTKIDKAIEAKDTVEVTCVEIEVLKCEEVTEL